MSTQTGATDPYESVYHRYEPHRAGIPKLGTYFKELWKRREFATEMSKASMRGANSMTFFGQAWLVINPLLLALVYYFLLQVLNPPRGGGFDAERFSHLTGGLFIFYFFQGAVGTGANSVVGAGKLVLNTAFPRLLMPLSAVRTGFFRFLPTVPVYIIFHILAGNPWNWVTFIVAPIFALLIAMFAAGLAALFAALQVYFRDAASFLPYVMRIWLYCSPVLWTIDMIQGHAGARALAPFNPLYPLIGGYGEALQNGAMPSLHIWLAAIGWAVLACVIGFGYFMSRERDFAVRL
ncbi:teichoic acid transport system permease protein [Kineosphaera limosa]|uniref:Putative ABC transporter permease protein n=1 Tax=Kineosphaera limosa NBRC 100340 TaxID=1184609 RepID=K6VPP2_9MICO|nr:ABC transporter permease [Kineosphaera limosa]NYE01959.1 teichoic acid transport system permease protein [Kineosphaera limosa]GAB98183.1 putative ABC transporter permease protein [Kineosphaera limosa NBRC 100340]